MSIAEVGIGEISDMPAGTVVVWSIVVDPVVSASSNAVADSGPLVITTRMVGAEDRDGDVLAVECARRIDFTAT